MADRPIDRLDDLLCGVAMARMSIGAAAFLAPRLSLKLAGLARKPDDGRDFVARLFASREIALGAGYLASSGEGRRLWTRLGVLADACDMLASLPAGRRHGVNRLLMRGITVASLGAVALGAGSLARRSA